MAASILWGHLYRASSIVSKITAKPEYYLQLPVLAKFDRLNVAELLWHFWNNFARTLSSFSIKNLLKLLNFLHPDIEVPKSAIWMLLPLPVFPLYKEFFCQGVVHKWIDTLYLFFLAFLFSFALPWFYSENYFVIACCPRPRMTCNLIFVRIIIFIITMMFYSLNLLERETAQ